MADDLLKKGRYTRYSNKIGLVNNATGSFINNAPEVVLNYPFKDTVLEAGMSKEDSGREERFLHIEIDKKDIDTLEDPKVLTDFRYIDNSGEHRLTKDDSIEFFDENGDLKQNLLIKGNNLLALYTLLGRFSKRIKLIYIDPPYNTKNDGFKYNDNFNHSSWLVFMKNRLEVAKELLSDDGVIFISCDDNEQAYLKVLCDEIFNSNMEDNFVATLPTIMNLKGNQDQFAFAGTHEYLLVYAKNKEKLTIGNFPITDQDELDEWEEDDIGYYKKGAMLRSTGADSSREHRPLMFYPVLIKNQAIYMITDDEYKAIYNRETSQFNDDILEKITKKYNDLGYKVLIPKQPNGNYGRWRWGFESMQKNIGEIIINATGEISLYKKQRPEIGNLPTKKPKSVFYKPEYSSGNGTNQIKALFGRKIFEYPKPEELIADIIEISTKRGDLVLDFVAGSGTTAAVAHKMNRRWISIEQMDYIENVTKERMKKVIAGEQGGVSRKYNWHGGGSLIYFELKKYNQDFIDRIMAAASILELEEIYGDMQKNAFLKFWFDKKEFEKDENFRKLDIYERKQALVNILDENQFYLNYDEMDDSKYHVADDEKALTNRFYGEGENDCEAENAKE